jgi:hypothetical protein
VLGQDRVGLQFSGVLGDVAAARHGADSDPGVRPVEGDLAQSGQGSEATGRAGRPRPGVEVDPL